MESLTGRGSKHSCHELLDDLKPYCCDLFIFILRHLSFHWINTDKGCQWQDKHIYCGGIFSAVVISISSVLFQEPWLNDSLVWSHCGKATVFMLKGRWLQFIGPPIWTIFTQKTCRPKYLAQNIINIQCCQNKCNQKFSWSSTFIKNWYFHKEVVIQIFKMKDREVSVRGSKENRN